MCRTPMNDTNFSTSTLQCTEDTLRSAFESYGAVSEVSIPSQQGSDRKLGFGFVQFDQLRSAAKAVKHMNGHKIMGRLA